jgi:hypothetical protein
MYHYALIMHICQQKNYYPVEAEIKVLLAAGTGILDGIDRRKVRVRVKILPMYSKEILEVEKLRR